EPGRVRRQESPGVRNSRITAVGAEWGATEKGRQRLQRKLIKNYPQNLRRKSPNKDCMYGCSELPAAQQGCGDGVAW
ncbi:mCG144762, partial [Mus musculus]